MGQQAQYDIIFDKQGRSYKVFIEDSDGHFLQMQIIHRNHCVGLARCLTSPAGELVLGDLIIFDKVPRPTPCGCVLFAAWSSLLGPINYRDRGLGSAFLEYIKRYASGKGYQQITGLIVSQEKPVDFLISWYRRHGFEVDDTQGRPLLFLDLTQAH